MKFTSIIFLVLMTLSISGCFTDNSSRKMTDKQLWEKLDKSAPEGPHYGAVVDPK